MLREFALLAIQLPVQDGRAALVRIVRVRRTAELVVTTRPVDLGISKEHIEQIVACLLLAAGIQVAASVPNFLCQEQVSLGEGYIKQPFKVESGYVKVPTAPGLGIELDEDAMQDKLGHDWRNPEPYDSRDGSVVDW